MRPVEPLRSVRSFETRTSGDRGSTIPLILGFWLVAFLFVSAAILATGVFTAQRGLQSACDGAAAAVSGIVDADAIRRGDGGGALPLASDHALLAAARDYLAGSADTADIVVAELSRSGITVTLECSRVTRPAFSGVIGRPGGITQRATSTAYSPTR